MSITVENLTHIYAEGLPEETRALDDVSFRIEEGEFVCIIGHTGSGKSTLLQHLNGLLKPKSGRIFVGDTEVTNPKTPMPELRKKVGLVFQYPEYQLFEEDVKTDVAFGPKNLGLDEEEIDRRVRQAIEKVGLDYEEIKEASPFELSGGQKRRVAIAGVLAMEPEILVLDEPAAGLDPQAHRNMLDMIKGYHEETGRIVILVSHNMDDVAEVADRVLVMDGGRLAMEGTPAEVFARGSELAEMGLGLPAMTEIICDLRRQGVEVEEGLYTPKEAAKAIATAIGKQNVQTNIKP